MIDAIINNGETSTPVSSPEAFPIPPAPKRMSPAKSPPLPKNMKIIPPTSNFDYRQMIGPSSDEENVSERSMSPTKKRRLFGADADDHDDDDHDDDDPDKSRFNIPIVDDDKVGIDDLTSITGAGINEDDDEEEEEDVQEGEDTVEDKITKIVEYLTLHDRSEIDKLLTTIEKEELFEEDVT